MRLSGKNMHFTLGDFKLKANKVTLSITDNTAVNKSNGVPDDSVAGDVEASGEIELTTNQFKVLSKAAKQAGSCVDCQPLTACSSVKQTKTS